MRKSKAAPKVHRRDKRCGDAFVREWVKSIGSVREAERRCTMYRGNLHNWLVEPERHFSPENTSQLAKASNCPIEAIHYRWVPIKDLHMWKFLEAVK